jgi:hypothetical protein
MTLTDLAGNAVKDADGNPVAPVTGCTFGFFNLLPAKYLVTITKPTDPAYEISPAKTQPVDLTTGSKAGINFSITYDKCDDTPTPGGCTYTQATGKRTVPNRPVTTLTPGRLSSKTTASCWEMLPICAPAIALHLQDARERQRFGFPGPPVDCGKIKRG